MGHFNSERKNREITVDYIIIIIIISIVNKIELFKLCLHFAIYNIKHDKFVIFSGAPCSPTIFNGKKTKSPFAKFRQMENQSAAALQQQQQQRG